MFEYVSVSDIILYLTSKVGPLPSINCTFYGCDYITHTTKLVAKSFHAFLLGPMFVRYKKVRSLLVIVFLCIFAIPKTEKGLNIQYFLF